MDSFSAVAHRGLRRICLGARSWNLGVRRVRLYFGGARACRAVVYRGPRLGASIGLAHRSLGVSGLHLGGITGLFGSLAPPILATHHPSYLRSTRWGRSSLAEASCSSNFLPWPD